MIYTNITKEILTKNINGEKVLGIGLGDYGKGLREVFIQIAATRLTREKTLQAERFEARKTYNNFTILSPSGRHVIAYTEFESDLYLILSSKKGNTSRGAGAVYRHGKIRKDIVAVGHGSNDNKSLYYEVLLKPSNNTLYKVVWSGHEFGLIPTFYYVKDKHVFTGTISELEAFFDYMNIKLPEGVHDEKTWAML